ncbi:hypothetical protein GCM10022249_04970 [Enteractinococcus coprophilus]
MATPIHNTAAIQAGVASKFRDFWVVMGVILRLQHRWPIIAKIREQRHYTGLR